MEDRSLSGSSLKAFGGFSSSETFVRVPETFFRQVLPQVDDLEELRATLYAFWLVERLEGPIRGLRREDFGAFATGLEKAVERGSLLRVQTEAGEWFFLNSPRGRAAVEAIRRGSVDPSRLEAVPLVERSNLFVLYEQHIGPLTPLIADRLREAEREYPAAWFEEAFALAVARNVRNWKYVEAILKRWKEQGKHEGDVRKGTQKVVRRYGEDEFAEYFDEGAPG